MNAMNIAILGCGPSGLLAAYTAEQLGADVTIISKKRPSYIAGAQYLHVGIHGLTSGQPDGYIKVQKNGTREGYAEKVYGYPQAPVSWSRYAEGYYPAWNMREIYRQLWDHYEDQVRPLDLSPAALEAMLRTGHFFGKAHHAVINTVPLQRLCAAPEVAWNGAQPHTFLEQTVHIRQRKVGLDRSALGENHIIYNGDPDYAWYRHSYIFGHEAYEYSDQVRKPPADDIVTIAKPLATDCTCYTDQSEYALPFFPMGRYGTWSKEALVHDVPVQTHYAMQRVERILS